MALQCFFAFDGDHKYPEWNASVGTTTGRDTVANHAGATGNTTLTCTLPAAAATLVMGIAFKIAALASTSIVMPGIMVGGTRVASITFDASGNPQLRSTSGSGTVLQTGSGATVAIDTWAYLEIKITCHASSGTCVVKLNGTTVINVTGVQTASASGSVTSLEIRNNASGAIDDMYVCDATDGTSTQGRANNDFLGDIKVAHLYPTSDGDELELTLSTGSSHFAVVDENPVNTSDYAYGAPPGSGELRDLWGMTDLPSSAGTVFGVREGLYALKTDAGAATIKPVIKENSTVTSDTAQGLSTSALMYLSGFKWKRPSDAAVWTVSDVNAIQTGVDIPP